MCLQVCHFQYPLYMLDENIQLKPTIALVCPPPLLPMSVFQNKQIILLSKYVICTTPCIGSVHSCSLDRKVLISPEIGVSVYPPFCQNCSQYTQKPTFFKCPSCSENVTVPPCPLILRYMLLGDSAYISREYPFIIMPARDNGALTIQDQLRNTQICKGRVVVEQAFGR